MGQLVHCIPKKGGITVVPIQKSELIFSRIVTRWRVCMDYRQLKKAKWKDHFLLSVIDHILDTLVEQEYYYFLNGYSEYNQIAIYPKDKEKPHSHADVEHLPSK